VVGSTEESTKSEDKDESLKATFKFVVNKKALLVWPNVAFRGFLTVI